MRNHKLLIPEDFSVFSRTLKPIDCYSQTYHPDRALSDQSDLRIQPLFYCPSPVHN